MPQKNVMHCNPVILDSPCHPASWGPIMRKAPTLSGQRSTGFPSRATRCSAGSSATSFTSCCETDIQTYVTIAQPFPLTHHNTGSGYSPLFHCSFVSVHTVVLIRSFSFTNTRPLLCLPLQVIKDSMRNKADLTDMSRMWVRTWRLIYWCSQDTGIHHLRNMTSCHLY